MKRLVFAIALMLVIVSNAISQTKPRPKNTFIRVYNASYNKMGKGNLLFGSDSTIVVIRHGKSDTFSVKEVFYIKTKRSAGHSVLMGTGIGTGVGMTVITVGIVVVSGDVDFAVGRSKTHKSFFGFASPAIGASIGGILGLLKKRVTYSITGNRETWKIVRNELLDSSPN